MTWPTKSPHFPLVRNFKIRVQSYQNPFLAATLPAELASLALQRGSHPAILSPGWKALSFAELIYEITALGAWLRTQGLGPGDRIALAAPWGPQTALAIFAIASSAVCVPINPRL